MDRVQALRFFRAHNHERLHRLIELGSPRHGLIVQLLPLLFHINSKLLPGYINDDVPAGLIDYQPDKQTLDKAQELEKLFKHRNRPLRRYPLRGLYLINPQGWLQPSAKPHYQLWLLHSDKLTDEQLPLLQQKLQAVADWANASGLKLNIKLLSETDLSTRKLAEWEADLLYSCGVVLAGSVPYWWLTTPQEDQNYADAVTALQSQRLLSQVTCVDFGKAAPSQLERQSQLACHTLNTSLQHGSDWLPLLYFWTSLQSKSATPLSALYKRQIYQQEKSFLAYDINYLKLLELEQEGEHQYAREAFYLASRELLSKPVKQAVYPWRRSFIEGLVEHWGWQHDTLKQLDHDSFATRTALFQRIRQSAEALLQQLLELNRQHSLKLDSQLSALHKRYQLRFHPAADAIDCLPQAMRPATNSERLYLQRFHNHSDWLLSLQSLQNASQKALFRHDNLLHVLAWAVTNHILSPTNWLSVTDQQQQVTTKTVVEISQQLFRAPLADSDLITDTARLSESESVERVIFISNLEQQPNDTLTQQGLQLSSKQNDPLNYTSFKQSLVMSIDGILQSSHGQWHSFSFNGDNTSLELLVCLLNWQPATLSESDISSWCPTPIFGQSITHRLVSLVAQVCRHYQQFPQSGRLLLNLAGSPFSLQWHEQAEYIKRPAAQDIWQALAANHSTYIANVLDNHLDSDGLLNYLLRQQSANRISVFIYLEQHTIICYLLDELGNLVRQQFQHLTESTLIAHLHKFLAEIKVTNNVAQLRFYRLSRDRQGWQRLPLAAPAQTRGYLPIIVTMSTPALNAECEVVCGQHHFNGKADDLALFKQIHQLVLNLRQQTHYYPIYLNSLIFADGSTPPTAVYMQQKSRLEQLFNPH